MLSHRKTLSTILLSVILVVAFMLITLTANRLIFADKVRSRDAKKLEAINRMLEDLDSTLSDAEQKAADQYEVNAVLTATALKRVISDRKDDAVETYRSGVVVKIENGMITAPGNVSQDLGLTVSLFQGEKGVYSAPSDASTLIAYSRIGETPYYYLEWYEDTDLNALIDKTINLDGILEEAEAAYGSNILLVRKDEASETGMEVLYRNADFEDYKKIGDMGLTPEEIEKSVGLPPQSLDLNGVKYRYSVGEVPSLNGYAILLVPETDIVRQSLDQIGGMVSILILILAGMVPTGMALYNYALKNPHAAARGKRYKPAFIKKAFAVYGMTGLLFMGISSAYLYSLNGLHEAAMNGGEALQMLQRRIVMNISRDSNGIRNTIDSYIDYGEHISEILGHYLMEAFLALFLLQQIPILSITERSQDSLYYYILKGIWERGINLFAIARIMVMAGEMILTVLVLNFILRLIGSQTGKKGETVCRLVMNIIKYLAFASFIGLSLYFLGVDKTTLLAALSILSLAVSLGSQSLIADIIAGISIIIEGAFDVGDFVEIGSHTGKVLEIGVRTTRILCSGNDIMVIGNKEIQTVINKSRRNTAFDISFKIRSDYPVDLIRELLERELPAIGAKNSLIVKGPEFEGITKIEDGMMTLAVETECRQADTHKVKLYVYGELQKLFAKNGIRV